MYDVAIIGAGVVGATIARQLSKSDLKIIVLEKEMDVAMGTSKANSGIVHAGYDCMPNTLMAKLNVEGSSMMEKLCEELYVPYKNTGSLVIAFDEEDEKKLGLLYENGIANGVEGMRIIDGDAARRIEPNLSDDVIVALHAKTASICSPYELTIALFENAVENGVEIRLNFGVTEIKKNKHFIVKSDDDVVEAKYVINVAGIYADEMSRLVNAEDFNLIPRKGEYILLDKNSKPKVDTVIFQTPSKMGKGVLTAPTGHGHVFAGPTSVCVEDKEDDSTTIEGLNYVKKMSQRSVKKLEYSKIITQFAGIRSVIDGEKDFLIKMSDKVDGFVQVAGICSPGLSSAPAIGVMVERILKDDGLKLKDKENFNPIRFKEKLFSEMNDNERQEAFKKNPKYGKVICRCESVTEAEIVDAIHSNVPAVTVDAIKRRTRASMGRCQGGFCVPRIIDILCRESGKTSSEIVKSTSESWIIKSNLRDGGEA